jgi:nucleotide-binding universal stress UspA family protein
MRVQRIMCPVDFSESSTAALDEAASLALQWGAQLLIVHVDEHPLLSGAASPSLSQKMAERRGRLEQTEPQIKGVVCEHVLLRGKAAVEIPRFARRQNVDLVVLARRDRAQCVDVRRDRVWELTIRDCACPVLTITHSAQHVPWAN